MKTNKIDTENTLSYLNVLQKQMQYMSIIKLSLIKTLIQTNEK